MVLLPATAAFGNELEDGTLPYLLMKPVSRLRLVLGKYTAVLLVTVPALIAGLVVTTAIAAQGPDPGDLGRVLAAMAGVSRRCRAVGRGLSAGEPGHPARAAGRHDYIFAWESLLGRFLPGVQAISSREYALRVFDGILEDDFAWASNAALTMLVVAVVCAACRVAVAKHSVD